MFPASSLIPHRCIFTFLFFLPVMSLLSWNLNLNLPFGTKNLTKHLRSVVEPLSQNETVVMTSARAVTFLLQNMFASQHPILLTDKRKMNRSELLEELANSIRNLPRPPFMSEQWFITAINESCAISPSILDVQFVNKYWQVVRKAFGGLFIYGAYYDNRSQSLKDLNGSAVRILGVTDQYLSPNQDDGYCQLRFENETQPVITKIIDRNYIWYDAYKGNNSRLHPYLFACQIPPSHQAKVPVSVSIVENPCDNALNILGVQYFKPKKKEPFAVCVKGLHLPQEDNLSIRLVEWIELMRLLGAEKIFLYEYQVHPNISKVMRYYQSTGFVDITPITLPGYLPGDPVLAHLYHTNSDKIPGNWMIELIHLNDCLYRNLHSYEYLAMVDTDEVIMPTLPNISTWNELLNVLEREHPGNFSKFGGISFRNIYFFDFFMNNLSSFPDIPEYMHTLQHVYRSSNYSHKRRAAKSFNNVEHVLTVNNHWPRNCLGGQGCKYLNVEETTAHLQHYKPDCPSYVSNCMENLGKAKLDTTIWKYKDKLIEETERVLKTLDFIKSPSIKDSISKWLLIKNPMGSLR